MKLTRIFAPLVAATFLAVPLCVADAPAAAPVSSSDTNAAAEAAQLLRQVHSQLETSQRTIELLREQALAAKHNEEVTAARLKLIELALAERHDRELASVQASNRLTLAVMGTIAALGLLGMIALAVFLFRATSKLAELPAAIAAARGLGSGGDGPRALLAGTTTVDANERLIGVIAALEQKFHELEKSVERRASNRSTTNPATSTALSAANAERVRQLLSQGQTLLNQEKAVESLAVFDEAAKLDPNDPEPLVRRGKALEKLGRMEDALGAYDRALAIDDSLTIAHLGKGGVFNRLERFGEALECYERALQTQSKSTTA